MQRIWYNYRAITIREDYAPEDALRDDTSAVALITGVEGSMDDPRFLAFRPLVPIPQHLSVPLNAYSFCSLG